MISFMVEMIDSLCDSVFDNEIDSWMVAKSAPIMAGTNSVENMFQGSINDFDTDID